MKTLIKLFEIVDAIEAAADRGETSICEEDRKALRECREIFGEFVAAYRAANQLIGKYGETKNLYDLPDFELASLSDLDVLIAAAGEEGPPRTLINNWNCWDATIADFCQELLERAWLRIFNNANQ